MNMKKLTFLFAILFFSLSMNYISAQNYYPLPNSNANWNENLQSCCFSDCGGGTTNPIIWDDHFSYYLKNDTAINTYLYKKIQKTGTRHIHCVYGNSVNQWMSINNYAGAYRQDTVLKKVYYYPPSGSYRVPTNQLHLFHDKRTKPPLFCS
jgi:hypothetical protein